MKDENNNLTLMDNSVITASRHSCPFIYFGNMMHSCSRCKMQFKKTNKVGFNYIKWSVKVSSHQQQTEWRCSSHQGSGEAEDGEQGTGGGESGVFTDSGLFPHLHISSCDVISQWLWDNGLPLLTQSNVTPEGILFQRHNINTRTVYSGVNTAHIKLYYT